MTIRVKVINYGDGDNEGEGDDEGEGDQSVNNVSYG